MRLNMSLSSRRAWIEMPSKPKTKRKKPRSLSSRRAWIEIYKTELEAAEQRSLSSRRAWIEILGFTADGPTAESLSSRRAWIEILLPPLEFRFRIRRSPHGERGLKFHHGARGIRRHRSLSSRRAWIEIQSCQMMSMSGRSLSSRRAWIEIPDQGTLRCQGTRRSPHGERGLKSHHQRRRLHNRRVALLTESVD